MGLGVTANRYFVGADSRNAQQNKTIAAMLSISIAFSFALAFVVMLIPEKILFGDLELSRWIMVLGVLTFSLEVIPQNAMNGLERYRYDTFLSIFSGGFVLGLAGYAAAVNNLELAMFGLVGGSLIRVVGGSVIIINAMGWRNISNGFPFSKNDVVKIFNFSLPMFLVSLLASTSFWSVGRIILNVNEDPQVFALYTIGLQWFALGMFLPGSVSRISVPKLVRSIETPKIDDPVKNHVILGMKLSLTSSIAVAAFGLLFSEQILDLYGNSYSSDLWFLGGFLFVAILASATQILGILIVVSNHQWSWFKLNLLFLVTVIVAALFFVKRGAWTGPIAFLIAYMSLLVLSIVVVKRAGLMNA
jgi:O-antigen/teichoic acid export membrane protein